MQLRVFRMADTSFSHPACKKEGNKMMKRCTCMHHYTYSTGFPDPRSSHHLLLSFILFFVFYAAVKRFRERTPFPSLSPSCPLLSVILIRSLPFFAFFCSFSFCRPWNMHSNEPRFAVLRARSQDRACSQPLIAACCPL